jgi:hypothetical protein
MTKPDANSPDPDSGANRDDAIWLDLVARLEGRDQAAGTGDARTSGDGAARTSGTADTGVSTATDGLADADGATGTSEAAGTGTGGTDGAAGTGTGGTDGAAGAAGPGADAGQSGQQAGLPRPFRDFDPLGLSAAAPVPVELSARERLALSQDAATDGPAHGQGAGSPAGPRDYQSPDDDPLVPSEFVPEEPPSLAGTDPLTMLAWLGAVGGPVALLLSAMFWRSAPLLAILGMVAAFAASLVFLIMQLPGEKDEHDDGARI